jgi:molecular chaperone GrpE (heat shock protein)
MKLQEKQLISDDELRVKVNFANYIRRFERENTNILEFGTQIPYTQKIKVINQKLYDYASEDRRRGEA